MPHSIDLTSHGLVALTRSTLTALRAALLRDAGPAAAAYLQEAGYAGGESLFASFRRWLAEQGHGAPESLDLESFERRATEYFRDTPRRVADKTNGYKADMLHGIWAQAPYLHNGSVPTLGQLMCPATRPARFVRGNVHYDEALVGFEWAAPPSQRYSPHDTTLVKAYDTTVPGKSNAGHTFGAGLCPDTSGLDPVRDRREIERRLIASPVGALLAYLKTL